MKNIKVAYSTGFWCTNIGNGFFSLGVEYVLKKILGNENVTIINDFQTYTTSYGKRLYPHKNQLNYIKNLEIDYLVLSGPILSKYFLKLWKDTIVELQKRGIGYIIVSAGMMKINEKEIEEIQNFMKQCPPYILCSRDLKTYNTFSKYATNAYNGICFAFFSPDYYTPAKLVDNEYWTFNFDKMDEPKISEKFKDAQNNFVFEFDNKKYSVTFSGLLNKFSKKTDRFTDAFIYIRNLFPRRRKETHIESYQIVRTDHRFYPHFRSKIYNQPNSFCADIPYGYLNIYANSKLTLSDRVHACAVTLAYGNSAMLFSKTAREGLLERVGATNITQRPVKLDMGKLKKEKDDMVNWLTKILVEEGKKS